MHTYNLSYNQYNNWKLPLNLAIGFHLLVAFSVLALPGLFKDRPLLEETVTVNLVTMNDIQAPPAAPPPQKIEQQEPVKKIENDAVPIPEKTAPPPSPEPVKAVSIKPVKFKKKKNVVKKPKPQQDLEKIKRERLAEALRLEQLAKEQERIAAEEAERLRKLREQQRVTAIKNQLSAPSNRPSRPSNSSAQMTALEQQYYAAIMNHVTSFWSLPEFKSWDRELQAVVYITISRNGIITNQYFGKKSGDATYDQFVRRTLMDASPLPAIPRALRKNKIEVGLRFNPESIN
ncbi:MAG: hypothetical protein D6B25_13760 [Desulfobulbaceae bacterium]|nr:MAG: hypothetical protein D6B25_13760 [Desulfobulbaceae bacterium]